MQKLKYCFFIFICFILLIIPVVAEASPTVHHWKHYEKGVSLFKTGKIKESIHEFEHAISQAEEAGYLRKLAEAYERLNQYQKAADTYYREALIHKKISQKKGDLNTYFAVLAKADKLNSELFYLEKSTTKDLPYKLAKFEPPSGVYLGAFIEKDRGLSHYSGAKYQQFESLTSKKHAIYFTYFRYGWQFPSKWVSEVKAAGGAVHLAFQPDNGLESIQDDEYLREFARAAKQSEVPIFLRFAGEMNGGWVKWSGNPTLYKEKFRLISKVMKEEAPNVAMVFSPAANPKQYIEKYYPGDQYVDWIGLSIYSVRFFNGDAKKSAEHVNPLDSLDYTYKLYSKRKPIMISEYGATHFSKAGNKDTTTFAKVKMSMLYHGVKLKYPRVKAIHWFSLNTLTDSHNPERKLNNFSLTENKKLIKEYSTLINDAYYLTEVVNGPNAAKINSEREEIVSLEGQKISNSSKGYVWVKTYDPYIRQVQIRLNGKVIATPKNYPFSFTIDPSQYPRGKNKLEAIVYDSKNRIAIKKAIHIFIQK